MAGAQEALKRVQTDRFDLVVLGDPVAGVDSHAVCRAVRSGQTNGDARILLLTADGKVHERGADAYLRKPFDIREVVVRVQSLLGQPDVLMDVSAMHMLPTAMASAAPVTVHGIEIDPARRHVRIDGRDVELTDQQFRLLYLLATHAGIVFSREALLWKIWRGDTFVTIRSVDTLIKRLRRQIESTRRHPRYLLTVWGVGYKFADV